MSNDVVIALKQRPWQRPLIKYFRDRRKAGKPSRAAIVAHRRAGKDRAATFVELEEALASPREVWHCLPEYKQARKVIWEAIDTDTGRKLIDLSFPKEIIARKNDQEMVIELKNGSLWRLVGADNFNSLVGSNPRHVTFSEHALTRPIAWSFVRPMLAANGGTALFISTPRGYNHFHETCKFAEKHPDWYYGFHPVSQTKLISAEVLEQERASMPEELYMQEYECSFSAANVGAVLGRRIEEAEQAGRIAPVTLYDETQPVILSTDIGFRDQTAVWFWQRRADGYALVDFAEASGWDADDWADHLSSYSYEFGDVWLPRDAKAKTFATKRSGMERLRDAGFKVRLTPPSSIEHRVNAARLLFKDCHFDADTCSEGLRHLRAWSYKWNEDQRIFSREPDHDEHSHAGDAFSYGALVMQPTKIKPKEQQPPERAASTFTLDALWEDRAAAQREWT